MSQGHAVDDRIGGMNRDAVIRVNHGCVGLVALLLASVITPSAFAQCNATFLEHYGGEASFVARSGSRTYGIFGDELFVYESLSVAALPDELGSLLVAGDHLRDLAASGSYAYLAARNSGLIVVDATNPAAPFVAGTLLFPDGPQVIEYASDHVYLGGSHDVFIVDVSTASNPTQVATYSPSAAYVGEIVVDGSTLYISTDNGVEIVDISNPNLPSYITTYYLGIAFLDLDVSNGVLVGMRRDSSYADVANVSNPATPTAQSIISANFLSAVALNNNGDRLFLGYYGTTIYDLTSLV